MALLRRRHERPRSLQGSATRITLDLPAKVARQVGKRRPWQEQAWDYFDRVPELKQSTWVLGNNISKVKLYVGVPNEDPEGDPIPVTDDTSGVPADVADQLVGELARLQSSLGGQGEILRELNMNLEVAGEAFIVGWGARAPSVDAQGQPVEGRAEDWDVRSISEVLVKGSGDSVQTVVKESPEDQGKPLDPATDTIIRVWQRHPRWSQFADCSLAGLLGVCEALVTLHNEVIATSRSRHNAGLLTIPNELSFGSPRPTEDDDNDLADELTEEITELFLEPVDDPSDEGATAPGLLRGPAEFLQPQYVRWIDLGRKSGADLDNRLEKQVERLARGMNLPVETAMGHQKTTFANAEQVDRDLFDDHLEPRCVLLCDALTVGFLRPQATDLGIDQATVQRVLVWFDPHDLVGEPDRTQDADMAIDRGAISEEAYRRARHFSEDDAPTDEERLRRAGLDRGTLSDAITLALLKLIDPNLKAEPIPAAPGAAPPAAAAAPAARDLPGLLGEHPAFAAAVLARRTAIPATGREVTAAARPRTDVGRQLMEIDRDLRSRLLVLADRDMTRALERAGNRLRSHPGFRQQLRNVPAHLRAAHIGPVLLADGGMTTDDLLTEAFDGMQAQFMSWGKQAFTQAVDVAGRVASGFSADQRAALGLRQAQSLEEAWNWLSGSLRALASAKLFDPAAGTVTVGEISDLSVPAGMIRQALAIAGGSTGIETNGAGSAWVAVSGGQPLGGIATGELLTDELRSDGFTTDAYQWVYGPASRKAPFEPHQQLDGLEFTGWDDDVLANTEGWPEYPYFLPGDHDGCLCDFVPIVVDGAGATRNAATGGDLSGDDAADDPSDMGG